MTNKIMKFTMTVAALAMTMLMAQCRKPNLPTPGGSYEGTSQYITFSTGDDSKIAIKTAWKKLDLEWQSTDKLYVYGSQIGDFTDGKYCGVLNIVYGVGTKTAKFGGKIDNVPAAGGKFRFYYFAGGSRSADLSSQDGTTAGLAASLVAMSVEDVKVKENTTEYGSTLGIPYAIALFDFKNFIPSTGTINMEIMGNTANSVSVDEKGNLTFTKAEGTDGTVTIKGVGTTKTKCYVAIMPVAANKLTFYGDGKFYFGASTVQFAAGKYYYNNSTTSTEDEAMEVPTIDCLPGEFSVSATKKVRFAKGNLQYLGTGKNGNLTPKWRFADHQYDVMGNAFGKMGTYNGSGINNSTNGNVDLDADFEGYYNGTTGSAPTYYIVADLKKSARDYFGWATSGLKQGDSDASLHMPYHTCGAYNDIVTYGAYGNQFYNFDGSAISGSGIAGDGSPDWGKNFDGGWRTLTAGYLSEWYYLIYTRTDANKKYSAGSVVDGYGNTIRGMILLPDDWTLPSGCSFKPQQTNWTDNKYENAQWKLMEMAGAVFLPASGYRSGSAAQNIGYCYYWSSTRTSNIAPYAFTCVYNGAAINASGSGTESSGFTVRLVQDVPASTK